MVIPDVQMRAFLEVLGQYYDVHARSHLPWRHPESDGSYSVYKILVSELMLQQTQVARVLPKYELFLGRFPTLESLAAAELGEVLKIWQGLGYNRRAKYLWLAAKQIVATGWPENLAMLPGVGPNTAGAIRAYAFNEPAIFIETNIRTVYIHHFAPDQQNVPDTSIRDLLKETLELVGGEGKEQPEQKSRLLPGALRKTEGLSQYRVFYWALMDYGTFLKTQVHNISQSKHYRRQSNFEGSKRQLRGLVIRKLSEQPLSINEMKRICVDTRLNGVLADLVRESLIVHEGQTYRLAP